MPAPAATAPPPAAAPAPVPFLDRDHSILAFNERVLDWARRPEVPLLERLRFLCIVSSNLDEFFEVRAAPHLTALQAHDQKGLYTADPRRDPSATFVHEAKAGDPALEAMAGGAGSSIGRGGMITKILAARRAAGSGASTVIAWGREPDVLVRLARGEAIGTLLVAQTQKQQARKQWMADHLQLRGAVTVDDGAVAKLRDWAAMGWLRAELRPKLLLPVPLELMHKAELCITAAEDVPSA